MLGEVKKCLNESVSRTRETSRRNSMDRMDKKFTEAIYSGGGADGGREEAGWAGLVARRRRRVS